MSRILLLIVILLWLCRSAAPSASALALSQGAWLFAGGLVLVVLFMGLWSRLLARQVRGDTLHRSLRRFHNSMLVARVMIPVWFGIAVFALGWGDLVDRLLAPMRDWPVELPALLVGTSPALLAWMALWWAQFPADRALREQSILVLLNDNLPVHRPPGFWRYFTSNLRLQLLFTLVPVLLILLVHDVASLALWQGAGMDLRSARPGTQQASVELVLQLISIGVVVLFVPSVLKSVLATEPLPASPLRQRLEELCRRTRLRHRDILLWHTDYNMGNAAVMGLIPQMRYILLSDVLLETMSDRQIEAVFAHEIGHVKYWHMGWYVVLIVTLLLLFFGPVQHVVEHVSARRPLWLSQDMIDGAQAVGGIGAFFLLFGLISRWFERQADLFAARMMQQPLSPVPHAQAAEHGAELFASALHRVAVVNNIPLAARNFTHGSIAQRMNYLEALRDDPNRTLRFDRAMAVLYAVLVVAFLTSGTWVILMPPT